ncbi:Cyclic nucleotidegated cation channellike, partial [Caligus rogercresseyi]
LENLMPIGWKVLDLSSDLIYIIDIFVRMHEGYLEQGLLVKDSVKLRKRYLKSKFLLLDALSIFPSDFYYLFFSGTCFESVPCPVIARLNRVLRLDRTIEFFEKTETRTNFPNAFRITKVVLSILLCHRLRCGRMGLSGEPQSRHTIHLQFLLVHAHPHNHRETPQPAADIEYLFVTVDFLIGVLIFATIVGNIGSMITNMNAARADFQNKMDAVKQYMVFRKVGKDLENRVIKWFDYLWSNKQSMDEESVLGGDCYTRSSGYPKKSADLQDCEKGLLVDLVLKLKLQFVGRGMLERKCISLSEGSLTSWRMMGRRCLLLWGTHFEYPGNKTGNRRTANVRSVGYSDLFSLSKDDLWDTLTEYPEAKR